LVTRLNSFPKQPKRADLIFEFETPDRMVRGFFIF